MHADLESRRDINSRFDEVANAEEDRLEFRFGEDEGRE